MNYQVTGNEYISLPAIRETDGAAENISFLYMGVKGMLEMYGQDGFLIPYAEKNGKTLSFAPRWSRDRFWIPAWRDETENVAFRCVYLAPIGERGFLIHLELCAPVIALKHYTDQTGDWQIVNEPPVRTRLNDILRKLEKQKHPSVSLYSTFLQPTDDMHNYPYLTYDNALVWYTLKALAGLLERPELEAAAEKVRDAVQQNCTVLSNGKRVFAWSTNLNGKWDIYDEPPGSLLLLPFYGFCDAEDEVWKNTEALIRSEDYPLSFAGHPIAEIGCKHAAHPWLLSICNSLLSGHSESALKHLQKTNLDNGIACESINEDTGACETGEAFATCAGFFAFALNEALSR